MAENPLLSQLRLGEVIRVLRKRTPLTVEQLATEVGVSAASVSGYERGTVVPGLVVLRRIVKTLAPHLDTLPANLWQELGGILSQLVDREELGNRLAQWGVPVVENVVLLQRTSEKLGQDAEVLWQAYGDALDAVDG